MLMIYRCTLRFYGCEYSISISLGFTNIYGNCLHTRAPAMSIFSRSLPPCPDVRPHWRSRQPSRIRGLHVRRLRAWLSTLDRETKKTPVPFIDRHFLVCLVISWLICCAKRGMLSLVDGLDHLSAVCIGMTTPRFCDRKCFVYSIGEHEFLTLRNNNSSAASAVGRQPVRVVPRPPRLDTLRVVLPALFRMLEDLDGLLICGCLLVFLDLAVRRLCSFLKGREGRFGYVRWSAKSGRLGEARVHVRDA